MKNQKTEKTLYFCVDNFVLKISQGQIQNL